MKNDLAVAGNWAAPSDEPSDILADLAKMHELVFACTGPPPPEVRPWCCKDAMVPGAKYVRIEGSSHPFFVCDKHLAELMKLAEA